MKYSISQYTHDTFRLRQIQDEFLELRAYPGGQQWVGIRVKELMAERLDIEERMYRYERHPNNRG